jgi:hypothetical protein
MDLLSTSTNTLVNMRDITDKEEEVIVEIISLPTKSNKCTQSNVGNVNAIQNGTWIIILLTKVVQIYISGISSGKRPFSPIIRKKPTWP